MLFIINVSLCGLILQRLYLLFKLEHFENERRAFIKYTGTSGVNWACSGHSRTQSHFDSYTRCPFLTWIKSCWYSGGKLKFNLHNYLWVQAHRDIFIFNMWLLKVHWVLPSRRIYGPCLEMRRLCSPTFHWQELSLLATSKYKGDFTL